VIAGAPGEPTNVAWWTGRALRLHAALLFGAAVSGTGSWLELRRALGGHQLAWAYAVEWPVIGCFCIVLWWRLLTEREPGHRPGAAHPVRSGGRSAGPGGSRGGRSPGSSTAPDDPGLVAWEAYLAALHAADPPGGPATRR
jgi:hypothetical protein